MTNVEKIQEIYIQIKVRKPQYIKNLQTLRKTKFLFKKWTKDINRQFNKKILKDP